MARDATDLGHEDAVVALRLANLPNLQSFEFSGRPERSYTVAVDELLEQDPSTSCLESITVHIEPGDLTDSFSVFNPVVERVKSASSTWSFNVCISCRFSPCRLNLRGKYGPLY